MAEENKYMDDAFKQLGDGFKVNYDPKFWEEAKTKLDDAMLDDAFKAAAASSVASPSFEPAESVDDMFMDSAFVDAASNQTAAYDAKFFEQFLTNEGDIAMDEAFVEAAGAQVANYLPEYWNDADIALKNEGLHYEYHSEYWKEAKRLLDKQDRRVFFFNWSTAAAVLLLLSLSGMYLLPTQIEVEGMQANAVDVDAASYEKNHFTNLNVDAIQEALEADRDFFDSEPRNNNTYQVNQTDLADNGSDDNSMQNNLSDQTNVLSGSETDDIVKTDVETFNSLNISSGIAERNKSADELTLMHFDQQKKTPINHLGISLAVPEPDIEIIREAPTNLHAFGLLAETGIGNKWGQFSIVPAVRNSFGFEYTYVPAGKNFEYGGNLKINHVRQNQLNAEERSDVYDVHGDVNKYWRKLQLKDMIYTNLNGFVNYNAAPRHKLRFGVGVEYLTAVRSNMSYVDDFTADITTVNNNWGVKEGLHKLDLRFSVGYEYQLDKAGKWAAQLTSNFGTFDRTDDDFIGDFNRDVELNLMLGLKYNIFGFKK